MNFLQDFLANNRNGNFFRKINALINVILVIHQLFILSSEAYYLDNNPYRHKQILGPKASFVVEWSVNWKERAILFQVSAETKGWVGFGLSKDGRMFYSDGIIGGVDSFSGKPYFNDIHVKGNRSVQVDDRQDWKLIGAWEKGKRTYLSFTRAMDTCDSQDHPITKDLVALIWAYGESDIIQYHMAHRGSVPVYLLDPVISEEIAHDHYRQIGPHSNLYLVQRWAVTNQLRLSSRPASVWCSVEQGPRLLARHDIVGMGAFLPTKTARLHVQKIFLYKCTSPQQTETQAFFEPYARLKGEECYLNEKKTLPLTFCRELIYVWGRGGKPFYFPEDIGIPIGESQTEYYLLETHFDNPKGKSDLDIEAGIEVIYSHRQKPNSASLLQIGYGPFGTFMIPPNTQMQIYGNCGPKCTSMMFPKGGANIFAVMLHSHTLGRRIRLKHFRNGATELPWILKDDNYDSEFQQMRLLSAQVTVLPGDQLTTECTYDSRSRNRTSFSGFSSSDEACSAFVYVSMRMPFFRCTSELPAEQLLSRYGVGNFTWDLNWQDRYVTYPKRLEGTWLGDVVDDEQQLGKFNQKQLQKDFKYSPHLESCPNTNEMMGRTQNQMFHVFTNNWQQPQVDLLPTKTPYLTSTVSYPRNADEYQEISYCHNEYSNEQFEQGHKITSTYAPKTRVEYVPENSKEYYPENRIEHAPRNRGKYAPENSEEYYPENRIEHAPRTRGKYAPENSDEYAPKRNRVKHAQKTRVEYGKLRPNPPQRPLRDFSAPVVPPPSPPPAPPLQHEDYYNMFDENSLGNKRQPPAIKSIPIPPSPLPPSPPPAPPLQHEDYYDMFVENGLGNKRQRPAPATKSIPIPPSSPQAPVNIFKFESEDGMIPADPTSNNRIPVPRQPPSPPKQSSEFKKRPRPKNNLSINGGALPIPPSPSPSPALSPQFNKRPKKTKYPVGTGGALPIPPPPPRPPVQSFDYNEFISNSQRDENPQYPTGLRIPLVPNEKPDPSNDKSIMNFFEQIASLFSSSSNSRDDPENIFSFQQYVHMNDNNLLKKRKAGAA